METKENRELVDQPTAARPQSDKQQLEANLQPSRVSADALSGSGASDRVVITASSVKGGALTRRGLHVATRGASGTATASAAFAQFLHEYVLSRSASGAVKAQLMRESRPFKALFIASDEAVLAYDAVSAMIRRYSRILSQDGLALFGFDAADALGSDRRGGGKEYRGVVSPFSVLHALGGAKLPGAMRAGATLNRVFALASLDASVSLMNSATQARLADGYVTFATRADAQASVKGCIDRAVDRLRDFATAESGVAQAAGYYSGRLLEYYALCEAQGIQLLLPDDPSYFDSVLAERSQFREATTSALCREAAKQLDMDVSALPDAERLFELAAHVGCAASATVRELITVAAFVGASSDETRESLSWLASSSFATCVGTALAQVFVATDAVSCSVVLAPQDMLAGIVALFNGGSRAGYTRLDTTATANDLEAQASDRQELERLYGELREIESKVDRRSLKKVGELRKEIADLLADGHDPYGLWYSFVSRVTPLDLTSARRYICSVLGNAALRDSLSAIAKENMGSLVEQVVSVASASSLISRFFETSFEDAGELFSALDGLYDTFVEFWQRLATGAAIDTAAAAAVNGFEDKLSSDYPLVGALAALATTGTRFDDQAIGALFDRTVGLASVGELSLDEYATAQERVARDRADLATRLTGGILSASVDGASTLLIPAGVEAILGHKPIVVQAAELLSHDRVLDVADRGPILRPLIAALLDEARQLAFGMDVPRPLVPVVPRDIFRMWLLSSAMDRTTLSKIRMGQLSKMTGVFSMPTNAKNAVADRVGALSSAVAMTLAMGKESYAFCAGLRLAVAISLVRGCRSFDDDILERAMFMCDVATKDSVTGSLSALEDVLSQCMSALPLGETSRVALDHVAQSAVWDDAIWSAVTSEDRGGLLANIADVASRSLYYQASGSVVTFQSADSPSNSDTMLTAGSYRDIPMSEFGTAFGCMGHGQVALEESAGVDNARYRIFSGVKDAIRRTQQNVFGATALEMAIPIGSVAGGARFDYEAWRAQDVQSVMGPNNNASLRAAVDGVIEYAISLRTSRATRWVSSIDDTRGVYLSRVRVFGDGAVALCRLVSSPYCVSDPRVAVFGASVPVSESSDPLEHICSLVGCSPDSFITQAGVQLLRTAIEGGNAEATRTSKRVGQNFAYPLRFNLTRASELSDRAQVRLRDVVSVSDNFGATRQAGLSRTVYYIDQSSFVRLLGDDIYSTERLMEAGVFGVDPLNGKVSRIDESLIVQLRLNRPMPLRGATDEDVSRVLLEYAVKLNDLLQSSADLGAAVEMGRRTSSDLVGA